MGWSYGIVNGREVGYSVEATCDLDGCEESIDRGLAYCCGGDHGGSDYACGGYFCSPHLFYTEHKGGAMCSECSERWMAAHPDKQPTVPQSSMPEPSSPPVAGVREMDLLE